MVLSVGKSSCGGLCTHEAALLPVEVEGPLENRLCLRGATGRLSKAMAQEAGLNKALSTVREALASPPDLRAELRDASDLPPDYIKRVSTHLVTRAALEQVARDLDEAVERCGDEIASIGSDEAEDIIVRDLRPRLEQLIAKVRAVLPIAASVPWSEPQKAIAASAEIREAYTTVAEAADEYDALRSCQSLCNLLTGGDDNATSRFGSMRSVTAVWPNPSYSGTRNPPPWPDDRLERLLWVVAHPEAGLWMPTHQEAIELWRASTTNKSAGLVEVGGVYMPPE